MLRKKEFDEFVKELEEELDEDDIDNELEIINDIDLSRQKPPSYGHTADAPDGLRVGSGPNVHPDDPYVESLEDKLCTIIEKIVTVPMTGVVGTHNKKTDQPEGEETPSKEKRRKESGEIRTNVEGPRDKAEEYESDLEKQRMKDSEL